jgi:hypothetical protein
MRCRLQVRVSISKRSLKGVKDSAASLLRVACPPQARGARCLAGQCRQAASCMPLLLYQPMANRCLLFSKAELHGNQEHQLEWSTAASARRCGLLQLIVKPHKLAIVLSR